MLYKGDTINIQCAIDDDITNWKIRAEFSDVEGNSVKIASSEAGGSDAQIYKSVVGVTSPQENVFILHFPSGETDNMEDEATLEIEVDTGDTINGQPAIYTIFQGRYDFINQIINWTTP